MADKTSRAFVCGYPIAHSRSPLIHNYWLRSYSIAGSYERREVAPGQFTDFVCEMRTEGYAGANVTIPHKEAAFALLEQKDEAAEMIGAVNTLWFEEGKLCGSNTDGFGFAANLDEYAPDWDAGKKTATILGAGGAARAILFALKTRGFTDIRVVNRTISRAQELCDHFGTGIGAHSISAYSWDGVEDLFSDTNLLVNTTSLGMSGEQSYSLDLDSLPDGAVVADIVYVPLRTPLLDAAEKRGLKSVDGLGMLLHQAAPGFERWFGKQPEVTTELRNLIIADMESGQ